MLFKINSGNQQIQPPACDPLVRFSHRLGESIRKPLWTHGVASKVLRPRFNRAQKTTPGVQMKNPICTTASARAFLIGDEKCGLDFCPAFTRAMFTFVRFGLPAAISRIGGISCVG